MSLTNPACRAQYVANGTTTAFATGFVFLLPTQVMVVLTDLLGNNIPLTQGTDYTVSGGPVSSGGAIIPGVGTVTCATAPTSGYLVSVIRVTPLTQQITFVTNDELPAASLENGLDLLTMMEQEESSPGGSLDRAIKYGPTEPPGYNSVLPPPAARAGKQLGFDANGNFYLYLDIGQWRGNWVTATPYVYRDLFQDSTNGNIYVVIQGYTSGASVAADVAAGDAVLVLSLSEVTALANVAAASATAAAGSATAASTSATGSASSATTATTEAGIATSAAGMATTQAGIATSQATNAATSATAAATSATAAAASATTAATYPIPLWVTGKAYVLNNTILFSNQIYDCLTAHTSGVFATDLAAGDWVLVSGLGTLSGDVTNSGNVATIGANKVTNAKAAQMATNTIKGNNTGATANASDLTASQVTTMLGLSSGFSNLVVLTSGTSWTIPAGITKVKYNAIGGGGSGAGSAAGNVGVGGGSGGLATGYLTGLTPGASIAYAIGAAGAGTSGAGANGGATTFNSTVTANGGTGAPAYSPSIQTGPAGGSASGGTINLPGQKGQTGGGANAAYGAGSGGDTPLGYGQGGRPQAASGNYATAGDPGNGYGAGGAGATGLANGGSGATGAVILEY
jgi:hypothetical protein